MTPTFQSQLNTTQEQRQEWREVYAYQVKHGEESAAVDASRILVLLADLDTALATWTFSPCAAKATCAAKAQATCPKCKAPYDGCLCVTCYKPMIEDNATLQGKLDTALAALEQAEARSSAVHLLIDEFGSYDGEHHKQWVLDQIARTIQGREGYARWRKSMVLQTKEDENGLDHWDEGIAP